MVVNGHDVFVLGAGLWWLSFVVVVLLNVLVLVVVFVVVVLMVGVILVFLDVFVQYRYSVYYRLLFLPAPTPAQ